MKALGGGVKVNIPIFFFFSSPLKPNARKRRVHVEMQVGARRPTALATPVKVAAAAQLAAITMEGQRIPIPFFKTSKNMRINKGKGSSVTPTLFFLPFFHPRGNGDGWAPAAARLLACPAAPEVVIVRLVGVCGRSAGEVGRITGEDPPPCPPPPPWPWMAGMRRSLLVTAERRPASRISDFCCSARARWFCSSVSAGSRKGGQTTTTKVA